MAGTPKHRGADAIASAAKTRDAGVAAQVDTVDEIRPHQGHGALEVRGITRNDTANGACATVLAQQGQSVLGSHQGGG